VKKKILLITKDPNLYRQGNYYKEWIDVLSSHNDIELVRYDFSSKIENLSFDKIIFCHSYFDIVYERIRLIRRFPFRYLPTKFLETLSIKLLFTFDKNFKLFKKSEIEKVFFSKNDYKNFNLKILISKALRFNKIITHTKNAIPYFKNEIDSNVIWIPFTISKLNFKKTKRKVIDVGFRGNFNDKYNNGIRRNFFNELIKIKEEFNFDLIPNNNGENFIHGTEYVDWLSSCKLIANTESAFGTVGPKFFESIACNTMNICPTGEYENILEPDKHYVSVKTDFSNLKYKIELFLNNKKYRSYIQNNSKILLQNNYIENYIEKILN